MAKAILTAANTLVGVISAPSNTGVTYDKYEGEVTVTPTGVAQVLPTREKVLTDNVTIEAIPYAEVPNDTGITVYIGEIPNSD